MAQTQLARVPTELNSRESRGNFTCCQETGEIDYIYEEQVCHSIIVEFRLLKHQSGNA